MTTSSTTSADTPLALVVDLFGHAGVEPAPAAPVTAAAPAKLRPRRPRAIGDTSSACASCHPDARAAVRYDSCVVCSPPAAQIALG